MRTAGGPDFTEEAEATVGREPAPNGTGEALSRIT